MGSHGGHQWFFQVQALSSSFVVSEVNEDRQNKKRELTWLVSLLGWAEQSSHTIGNERVGFLELINMQKYALGMQKSGENA